MGVQGRGGNGKSEREEKVNKRRKSEKRTR